MLPAVVALFALQAVAQTAASLALTELYFNLSLNALRSSSTWAGIGRMMWPPSRNQTEKPAT